MPQTLLVTGASSGFGRAIALHFLAQGWQVLAAMRRPALEALGGPHERLRALRLDVTDRASIAAALAEGQAAFGAIDVVVNNAGIGLLSAFEATPEALWREQFETNAFGVMAVCQAAIPLMRAQGHGTLVNVSSSAGIVPMPLVAAYTASKWAVEGFTEALAYELGEVGLRARLVVPGLAPTTRFAANGAERMAGLTPPPYAAYAAAYFDRMGDYPTAFTSDVEVAEAAFAAATEGGDRLRYLAGADTRLLAELRWGGEAPLGREELGRRFMPVSAVGGRA